MKLTLTDEQHAAIESLEPISKLLDQIATYRKVGEYRFAQDFPQDYAKWIAVADLLQKSSEIDIRRYGITMKRYVDTMAQLDETPANTYRFRRRLDAVIKAADKLTAESNALAERVV